MICHSLLMATESETFKFTLNNRSFAACRTCGKRRSHLNVEEVTRTTYWHLGSVKTNRSVKTIENPTRIETCCDKRLKWIAVKAKRTDHKCDARCRNAKSGDCDCSCGGVNHGLG
jgi:hypothetical protein